MVFHPYQYRATTGPLPKGSLPIGALPIGAATGGPHVLIDIMGGEDQANSLRQIAQFGLGEDMAIGGALFELESILVVPDAARIGWWTMEWWWAGYPPHQGIRPNHAAPDRQSSKRTELVRLRRTQRAGAHRQSGELA